MVDIRSRIFKPRQREAVALMQSGLSRLETAEAMGIDVRTVGVYLSYARSHGAEVDKLPILPKYLTAFLGDRTLAQFKSAAHDRKMEANELATRLLRNIVNDDLFNAILEK